MWAGAPPRGRAPIVRVSALGVRCRRAPCAPRLRPATPRGSTNSAHPAALGAGPGAWGGGQGCVQRPCQRGARRRHGRSAFPGRALFLPPVFGETNGHLLGVGTRLCPTPSGRDAAPPRHPLHVLRSHHFKNHQRFIPPLPLSSLHSKGKWREIAKKFVPSRSPTQVASHAQKHFIRLARGGVPARRRSRFSAIEAAAAVRGELADPSLTVIGRGGPGGATGLGALLAAASVEAGLEAALAASRAASPASLRASPSPIARPVPRPASDVALDKLAETLAPSPPPPAVPAPTPALRAGSAFAPARALCA